LRLRAVHSQETGDVIKTKIVEIFAIDANQTGERELGWAMLPESPIEKKVQGPDASGKLPQPLLVKVNDENYAIVGHSWNIKTKPFATQAEPAELVLIVQKIPPPSSLVKAPATALSELDRVLGPKGGRAAN